MPITDPPRLQGANLAGQPYLHPCPWCRHDFAGRELARRHRNRNTKVCMSVEEMWEMGWFMDTNGRWRQRHGHRKPEG